jgi:hypothetical protein
MCLQFLLFLDPCLFQALEERVFTEETLVPSH